MPVKKYQSKEGREKFIFKKGGSLNIESVASGLDHRRDNDHASLCTGT